MIDTCPSIVEQLITVSKQLIRYINIGKITMKLVRTREDLGARNRRSVLSEILQHGPLSRTEIARNVNLTAASVSRITRDLIHTGLIEETEHVANSSGPGRKFVGLKLKPGSGFVAGIAINAFRQDVIIADLANAEVAQRRLNIGDLSDAESVLKNCVNCLNRLIVDSGIERNRLLGCGLAITGAIEPVKGLLRSAPLLQWSDVAINDIVRRHIDIPLTLESIANAKVLAAHCFGPAKGVNNLMLFNSSLAVCASMVVDGQLVRGGNFSAGLIESMLVPEESSGKLVSVDHIAGGLGVIDRMSNTGESHSTSLSGRDLAKQLVAVINAADDDDIRAQQKLNHAGRALAWPIIQSNALLHPKQILVSGPMIESDYYREGIRSRLVELADEIFVKDKLRFYRITSHGAAQSLAVYHFLVRGDQDHEVLELAKEF